MRADAPTFMPYVGEVQRFNGAMVERTCDPIFTAMGILFKGLRDLFQGLLWR